MTRLRRPSGIRLLLVAISLLCWTEASAGGLLCQFQRLSCGFNLSSEVTIDSDGAIFYRFKGAYAWGHYFDQSPENDYGIEGTVYGTIDILCQPEDVYCIERANEIVDSENTNTPFTVIHYDDWGGAQPPYIGDDTDDGDTLESWSLFQAWGVGPDAYICRAARVLANNHLKNSALSEGREIFSLNAAEANLALTKTLESHQRGMERALELEPHNRDEFLLAMEQQFGDERFSMAESRLDSDGPGTSVEVGVLDLQGGDDTPMTGCSSTGTPSSPFSVLFLALLGMGLWRGDRVLRKKARP